MSAPEYTKSTESIPGGYNVYTLFLIPSLKWSSNRQNISKEELWDNFYDFGKGIGEENLSVWFVTRREAGSGSGIYWINEDRKIQPDRKIPPTDSGVDSVNITDDIIRCKDYCDKFKLDYNEGPFVVITEKHPDVCTEKDIDVVKFNWVSPDRVILFLNEVEQKIRTGKPRKGVSRFTHVSETLSTWLSEHKEDIIKFASPIKVTIPLE